MFFSTILIFDYKNLYKKNLFYYITGIFCMNNITIINLFNYNKIILKNTTITYYIIFIILLF